MRPDLARRQAVVAMAAMAAGGVAMSAGPASASASSGTSSPSGGIPPGFGSVDPRTAKRVPLWQPLNSTNPIFEGDPEFTYEDFTTVAESGYLLEVITNLGTHTGTHISAPVHFVEGAKYLDEIGERLAMMPLTVIDVRGRVKRDGGDFTVDVADLKAWEAKHGRFPANGCVLLLTGFGKLFDQGEAYSANAPGFTAEAVTWLFTKRRTYALGSDNFGPDATLDTDYSATFTALSLGGITVENVGAGLSKMRAHGDWISINGGRPHFSGFQMGITGFTR